MDDQIMEAIKMVKEEFLKKVNCPAYKDLFVMYKGKSTKLDKVGSSILHNVTAKLLFINKRARADIETAVLYFTTRAKNNEREWYNK